MPVLIHDNIRNHFTKINRKTHSNPLSQSPPRHQQFFVNQCAPPTPETHFLSINRAGNPFRRRRALKPAKSARSRLYVQLRRLDWRRSSSSSRSSAAAPPSATIICERRCRFMGAWREASLHRTYSRVAGGGAVIFKSSRSPRSFSLSRARKCSYKAGSESLYVPRGAPWPVTEMTGGDEQSDATLRRI